LVSAGVSIAIAVAIHIALGPLGASAIRALRSASGFWGDFFRSIVGQGARFLGHRGLVAAKTTSGAALLPNPDKTTTVIGSFEHDLKAIFYLLNTPLIRGSVDDLLWSFKNGNPGGFNFLNVSNVSNDLFLNAKHGRGGFFDSVNKPWLDEAVSRGDDILIVSSREYMTTIDPITGVTKNTGFGKEVKYLMDTHGDTWNADYTRLLAP